MKDLDELKRLLADSPNEPTARQLDEIQDHLEHHALSCLSRDQSLHLVSISRIYHKMRNALPDLIAEIEGYRLFPHKDELEIAGKRIERIEVQIETIVRQGTELGLKQLRIERLEAALREIEVSASGWEDERLKYSAKIARAALEPEK